MECCNFRVWDKENKRMITNTQEFIPLTVTNIGILRLSPESEEDLYTLIPFGDRFIPMQSSDKKDINGKDIYAGDIGLMEHEYNTISKEKDREQVKIEHADDGSFIVIRKNRLAYLSLSSFLEYGYMIEVTGNVFENYVDSIWEIGGKHEC